MMNRHITALVERGAGASLRAWVTSRVEQLLSGEYPLAHPNGVIVTTIDPAGEVDITIEPLGEGPTASDTALLIDAAGALVDAAGASVWARLGDTILTPPMPPATPRGSRSLVLDLAKTMRYNVAEHAITPAEVDRADELFLVSDVFGVIAVDNRAGEFAQKIATGLTKL